MNGEQLAERPSKQRASLLEDSLSESDIPDLELIPPNKAKRKKFSRKLPNPRIRVPSFSGGDSNLPRCWTCALSFLLLSLTVGLFVLAWFTIGLYKEIVQLRKEIQTGHFNNNNVIVSQPNNPSIDYTGKIEELGVKIDNCCVKNAQTVQTSIGTTSSKLPSTTLSSSGTVEVDNTLVKLTDLDNELTVLSEIQKNLTDRVNLLELMFDKSEKVRDLSKEVDRISSELTLTKNLPNRIAALETACQKGSCGSTLASTSQTLSTVVMPLQNDTSTDSPSLFSGKTAAPNSKEEPDPDIEAVLRSSKTAQHKLPNRP